MHVRRQTDRGAERPIAAVESVRNIRKRSARKTVEQTTFDLSAALDRWIGSEREARVIVAPDGRILWTSASARQILDAGYPFRALEGRLSAADQILGDVLQEALTTASERSRCWLVDHASTWVIWSQRIERDGTPCVGLTLRGGRHNVEFTALAEAGGLTRKEARVVALMLTGADPATIAGSLNISIETLRTHVKHAYRKLGVTSRGELFAGAINFLEP